MVAAKKKPAKAKKKDVISVFRGKRKESIARASIRKGKGVIRINSVRLDAIDNKYVRQMIAEPLTLAPEVATQVDIAVNVFGGGQMGQAQACRTAIARALVGFSGDEALKRRIIGHDKFMIAEDSRRVEPKKYKGPKARARFQKSYR
ncbi:MAG: 30S ribosomal protein S9 [Candidatus Micrarchaeota archaeon]|nr:30S ribosomal protein S9 [Candidatus Micrarchaeota archaeon]